MRRSAPMPAPRRYDSARAVCVAPRASLGRLRSMIQTSLAAVSNRSPHSSSPAISDTGRASILQVDIICGTSSVEVSYSVMEEPGASPSPLLRRIARTWLISQWPSAVPNAVHDLGGPTRRVDYREYRSPGAQSDSTDTPSHSSVELRT